MGDRVETSRLIRSPPSRWEKRRTPAASRNWGFTAGAAAPTSQPATIGHNNGPPFEADVNDACVRYRWKKAHAEAWKNPSMAVMKFRVARAAAAGVSYRTYMLALLDSGRHLQAGDVDVEHKEAQSEGGGDKEVGDKVED